MVNNNSVGWGFRLSPIPGYSSGSRPARARFASAEQQSLGGHAFHGFNLYVMKTLIQYREGVHHEAFTRSTFQASWNRAFNPRHVADGLWRAVPESCQCFVSARLLHGRNHHRIRPAASRDRQWRNRLEPGDPREQRSRDSGVHSPHPDVVLSRSLGHAGRLVSHLRVTAVATRQLRGGTPRLGRRISDDGS